jgi:prepilin-type N-terminal cleavage/methylation domain-containing protein
MKPHPQSAMNIPTSHRSRGFTLVELLVVIAIIAVLAAAGFAAGNAAIQRAKKTTCQASAVAIEAAVNNFFTEYGSIPSTAVADETVETDKGPGIDLLKVLLGLETTDPPLNTRGVKLLSVKEGKKKGTTGSNGLIYSDDGKSVTGLYDPWGGSYNVMLDCDYDERVTPAPTAGGGLPLNKRVAVWSDGADGVDGGGEASDDVKTW